MNVGEQEEVYKRGEERLGEKRRQDTHKEGRKGPWMSILKKGNRKEKREGKQRSRRSTNKEGVAKRE